MTNADANAVKLLLDKLTAIEGLLRQIDQRLTRAEEEASRCGHGTTGICMACVIQYDLLRTKP